MDAPTPSRRVALVRALLAGASLLVSQLPARAEEIAWAELPPLPPASGQTVQPGVAGAFAGTHAGALIVAGGANFPERAPWLGGAKVWWDDVWVLERGRDGRAAWVTGRRFKLPRRLGYGVSVSVPEGVVCAGGHNADGCYAEVFLLSWDARRRELRRTELPSMPQPLTFMAGAVVGRTLYVAGGQHTMKGGAPSAAFWSLDLTNLAHPAALEWRELPTWPGPARIVPVAAAQRTAGGETFFLFGGRAPVPGRPAEIFTDAYEFEPASKSWRRLPNVGGGAGVSVMAGTAWTGGGDEILVFGGDRGDLFLELERHDLAADEWRRKLAVAAPDARAASERQIETHLRAKQTIYEQHPGFSREVLGYDARRNTWRVVATAPQPLPVTTVAVPWDGGIVFPSGEIKPGIRTPAVLLARPGAQRPAPGR